ncbi:MFS transporter [Paenirhodobacter populi]|uniref:MFS transporter n=1 Tax=Paenirhodobacter populi TaxID=2306993 RepID=A0A443KG71_9RHOB|nr:MFS transporter [Sinirhodobacter populi]RWR08714.1 MFS transporter [Sinirhodobacter populi]RWR31747.1 MFS transporter [Sinirhodobacter populi]
MTAIPRQPGRTASETVTPILIAVSLCHLLNDVMQSMLSAIYPMLKDTFQLDYWHIGLLTLAFQGTASLLQPAIGLYTDKHPLPWSLPFASLSTLIGVLGLAFAPSYTLVVLGAMLIGFGSAIFHPESSRVARLASGGRFGLAQSVFQVGGNFGTAIGPLLAAFVVVPLGRTSVALFAVLALISGYVLFRVGQWYKAVLSARARMTLDKTLPLGRGRVILSLVVLTFLLFTKNIYLASMSSYYTFYQIETFGVGTQTAQVMLFLFLGAVAAGTVLGGPVADRWGPMTVIWISILGILPFTLALPHVGLFWSGVLSVIIGLILASAFPAIVVFAQELVPGRVGMVAGIFFGLSFGFGGIAAAALGVLADLHGIRFVYIICSVLPAFGVLTIFLPRRSDFVRGT